LVLYALMVWYIAVQAKKLILLEEPTTSFNELYFNVESKFGERMGEDLRYDFSFQIGNPDFSVVNLDATYYTTIA